MRNPIISQEEKRRFEDFFERKLEGLVKSTENGIETYRIKVWRINKDDSGKDNFNNFLALIIPAFHHNNDKSNGILINCNKGDGISWLAEKTLDFANASKDSDDIVETIKKEESKFPIISKFIGGEKKLIKLAIEENFIEKISSSFVSNIVIFLVTLAGIITFIPDTYFVLEKLGVKFTIFQWRVIVGLIIFVAIVFNLYDLINKLVNNKKKEKHEFLKKLKNNDIEKDDDYKSLINKIVKKMDNFDNKKIIIIDDIASIDKSNFSQEVILKYIENKSKDNKYKKIFWIIFNSDLSITSRIRAKSGVSFFELTLLSLDKDERKKLCADLNLNESNASFDTIKEISKRHLPEEAKQLLSNKLYELKESNINLFNFVYLLILNDFPRNSEYKMKQLIEKMSPRKEYREKEEYIKIIFETVPNQTLIENYFDDEKIKKYYEYDKISDSFIINDDISCLIAANPKLFDYEKNYNYGQEYWALTWYFSFREKPQVHCVKKISLHLQLANSGIEDVKVRTGLLNAHLFTAEKSLSYLQKKDVEQILNHAFKLSIQNIEDIQKNRTAQMVLEAFMNFNYFPDIKTRFEDLDCEELYKFIKTRDISLVNSLIKNESYLDYIIYFLLEQYWEKMFFLWTFNKASKEDLQYNLTDEISKELKKLNTEYFVEYFEEGKNHFSTLYLFNLALYIWIDYIRLLNNDDSIQIEQIIQHIEFFLSCYKKKTKTNIPKDDVYQLETVQESVCFVASITILLLKKQDTKDKAKELADILRDLKNIFSEVEIDISTHTNSIDDIMRFLLLHSLMWKNCDFSVRYSMLSIIRVQLFLFSSDDENISDEIVEKAKAILRITEQIDNKNHLTTLLRFSLYSMNSDLVKDKHRSSFFFQQAMDFTDKDKISNIQFEYLYFCIQECWYHSSEKLKEILKCFVKTSDDYFDKIVKRICEKPDSYLHICNCINTFKNDELPIPISNTGYTIISFFSKILEQAKLNENLDLKDAECIWENYKFQRLLTNDKKVEKQIFEEFWQNREDNIYFGNALRQLFELNENNIQENTMSKAYNFLISNEYRLLNLSSNLIVSCHFCNEKKNKKDLDEEYSQILESIKFFEPQWEKQYKDVSYPNTIFLYETLYEHTKQYEYFDKKKPYELLETQKKIENFEITDYFGFFYSLWEIFKNDLGIYDDISSSEEQLLKSEKRKEFLESINYNIVCAIVDETVSSKFLILYRYKDINFIGKEKVQGICKNLAESNINNLIQLIMQTSKNRKHFERIQKLFEGLNKREVYDNEE